MSDTPHCGAAAAGHAPSVRGDLALSQLAISASEVAEPPWLYTRSCYLARARPGGGRGPPRHAAAPPAHPVQALAGDGAGRDGTPLLHVLNHQTAACGDGKRGGGSWKGSRAGSSAKGEPRCARSRQQRQKNQDALHGDRHARHSPCHPQACPKPATGPRSDPRRHSGPRQTNESNGARARQPKSSGWAGRRRGFGGGAAAAPRGSRGSSACHDCNAPGVLTMRVLLDLVAYEHRLRYVTRCAILSAFLQTSAAQPPSGKGGGAGDRGPVSPRRPWCFVHLTSGIPTSASSSPPVASAFLT